MLHTDTGTPGVRARTERLEARLTTEQKELFERAAALQGKSVSAFVVTVAENAAIRTIQEADTIRLTGKDREAFVAALLNPPAPSKKLRQAAAKFKREMGL